MSFKNIAGAFGGIVDAVKVMLTALPVGADDKRVIGEVLDGLEKAAEEIAKTAGAKITVRKSDVEPVVKALLAPMVADAVKAHFEAQEKGE